MLMKLMDSFFSRCLGMKPVPFTYLFHTGKRGLLWYKSVPSSHKEIPQEWVREGMRFWLLKSFPSSEHYLILGEKDGKPCMEIPKLGHIADMGEDLLDMHYCYGRGMVVQGPTIRIGGAWRRSEQNTQPLIDAILQNEKK